MFLGLNKRSSLEEMTYEDFLETYGRPKHSGVPKNGCDSTETEQFPTPEKAQVLESKILCSKSNCYSESKLNQFHRGENIISHRSSMILSSSPNSVFESRRRTSKFQNMANRLSRKSFRGYKKKSASDSSTNVTASPSKSNFQSSKWKPFVFKRSRSDGRNQSDKSSISSGQHSEDETHQANPSLVTSFGDDQQRSFVRSISHSPVATSSNFVCAGNNRERLNSDDDRAKKQLKAEANCKKLISAKRHSSTAARDLQARPTFLPLSGKSKSVTSPELFTPEYEVIKKYDDIREGEESRLVAITTLLKRRRNSLKIKCDQFNKELSQKNVDEERAKIIRARMRQMKRKLEVVDQCLEEQVEERKATTAKVDLILSLELYKLNLLQEEKNGFSHKKSHSSLTVCSPLSMSSSCETLLSVDDVCVFDDSSSVTSSKKGDSTHSSPTRHWRRYSAFGPTTSSSSQNQAISFPADELAKTNMHTNRSQSIDNTVTSDCDSGFDNGEGLSRSDVSLNRSFSKSTGSIESGCTRGNYPRTISSPVCSRTRFFFGGNPYSSSEMSLSGGKQKTSNKFASTNTPEESKSVDPSVLAKIDDFEKFAERTRRRLSLNGKLVPLKKGC